MPLSVGSINNERTTKQAAGSCNSSANVATTDVECESHQINTARLSKAIAHGIGKTFFLN
jgi:hypothetical protein